MTEPSSRSLQARAAAVLLALVLGGCALTGPRDPGPGFATAAGQTARYCIDLLDELDRLADVRRVADAGSHRVQGFPFLRVDRFLGSFRLALPPSGVPEPTPAFTAWVEHLRQLDRDARRIELANLPDADFPVLRLYGRDEIGARVETCGQTLAATLQHDALGRTALVRRAVVPDDYSTLRRAIGLYPITGIGYSSSVRNWQTHAREVFRQHHGAGGQGQIALQQYRPGGRHASAADALQTARAVMADAPADPLGIPRIPDEGRARLLAAFAPTFVIATGADSDRFGALQWIDLKGLVTPGADPIWLDVDTSRPTVYQRFAWTRIGRSVLPQLVYTVWFSERPVQESGDLQAGRLDSLVWRVTLDEQGQPLIYDTIHGNGQFGMEFPTSRMRGRPRPDGESLIDWVFVPLDQPVERWVGATEVAGLSLFVSSQTHQIVGLGKPDATWGEPQVANPDYLPVADERLQRLALPDGGSRSIFDPDGIVPGTERLGRYFFWPMGVANAGAIRQWGRQPTALIGRRHFDDADVIDRRFERVR